LVKTGIINNRLKNILVALMVLGVIFSVNYLMGRYLEKDPYLPDIKSYISSHDELTRRFGLISNVTLTKLTKVNGTPSSQPYRIYTFYVEGESNGGVVEIIASNFNAQAAVGDYSVR